MNTARSGKTARTQHRCSLRPRRSRFVQIFRTTPPKTVCPNFFVLAHANGCAFSPACTYCYLKSSLTTGQRRTAFTNTKPMIDEVRRWIRKDNLETYMLNTGNLSDSLSFENVRPVMGPLVELFRREAAGRPHTLLIVTKGGRRECRSFLSSKPCRNVVISFSINTPEVAETLERGAASIEDRMSTAETLKKRGWRVRIRLDPIIAGHDYSDIIARIRKLRPERVTLGTLRAEHNLDRFVPPGFFDELQERADRKSLARYPFRKRRALYQPAVDAFKDICPIGMCEEQPAMWDALGLDKESKPCNCCI